ncbi:hypothetical protein NDU88_008744 [Pleurodeles waltl]|uniref:Uncharacterized protein n=1 Tax=Pleurodeles waltl TaxID=8319 RepID=A0AAV7N5W3_PLEWA|nr:hypothetical protein NDU88_008744 [Pleurodeles waltl]
MSMRHGEQGISDVPDVPIPVGTQSPQLSFHPPGYVEIYNSDEDTHEGGRADSSSLVASFISWTDDQGHRLLSQLLGCQLRLVCMSMPHGEQGISDVPDVPISVGTQSPQLSFHTPGYVGMYNSHEGTHEGGRADSSSLVASFISWTDDQGHRLLSQLLGCQLRLVCMSMPHGEQGISDVPDVPISMGTQSPQLSFHPPGYVEMYNSDEGTHEGGRADSSSLSASFISCTDDEGHRLLSQLLGCQLRLVCMSMPHGEQGISDVSEVPIPVGTQSPQLSFHPPGYVDMYNSDEGTHEGGRADSSSLVASFISWTDDQGDRLLSQLLGCQLRLVCMSMPHGEQGISDVPDVPISVGTQSRSYPSTHPGTWECTTLTRVPTREGGQTAAHSLHLSSHGLMTRVTGSCRSSWDVS